MTCSAVVLTFSYANYLETRRFKTIEEYQKATGQDHHSTLVDCDSFVKVPKLDARDVQNVQKLYKRADFDSRRRPNSPAIDRWLVLPNVTDGYAGKAPDLGALSSAQLRFTTKGETL
jgi:hypothetical protein